jgi:flagellar biosynthesis protein FlhG
VLDLGPGTYYNTLDFCVTPNTGILVLTPEMPSIENTFNFIKAINLRKLKHIISHNTFNSAVKTAITELDDATINANAIIKAVLRYDPEKEVFLKEKLIELKFKIILNFCRKNFDTTLGHRIEKTFNRHFYSNFEFLGNIRFNDSTYASLLSKYFFVLQHPNAPVSSDLRAIANRLTRIDKSEKNREIQ